MISLSFWTISLSLNCCWAQRGGKPAELARPIMCGAQRRKHTHKCFRPCGECLILSLNCCAISKLRASRSFMSRIDYLHAFWMICHSELFRCLCTAAERSEAASRPSLRGRPCAARSNANTHTPCSNFWTVTKCSRPCGECSIRNCFAVSKLPPSAARRQAGRACEADHVWRVATQTHTHTPFSACLLDDLSYSYNCLRTCAKCCILSLNCRSLN